ncbi:MAG: hypothetical protein ACRD6X_04055 [Pyrinomonadaceae bacterium]
MTTVNTKIPDTLFQQAKSIAEREELTLDQFISLALASQISSFEVGQEFSRRAKNGNWKDAQAILANAPDKEPEEIDKL